MADYEPAGRRGASSSQLPSVALTVVVVTYRSSAVIRHCLEALPAALEGIGGTKIVVADNRSDDGTLDIVSEVAPNATVVQLGRNAGYAAGINAALAVVQAGRAVLVLNPDVTLRPRSVRRLLAALDAPRTGIVVPKLIEADGRTQYSLRRDPTVMRALGEALLGGRLAGRFTSLGEVLTTPTTYDEPRTADWATGAVMLISRSCLDAVGTWDESFFLYSEETEWALRARDAGFVLRFVPDAVAEHVGGGMSTSPNLWALRTVNRVKLYRRRHGRLSTAAFWLAVTLNEALRVGRDPTHRAALRALFCWRSPRQAARAGRTES